MKILLSIALTLACLDVHAQESSKIFTSDIDNFWVAYDSIRQVDDFTEKLGIINRLYIDRGTPGLQAFMKARDYNDTQCVKLIDAYPKFWDSIRTNTLSVKDKTVELNAAVEAFLERSEYFEEEIDKEMLMRQYEESLPYIVEIGPFENGSNDVDPSLVELRITFSKAMNTKGLSFNYTDRGGDFFPITKRKGYEDDDRTLVLIMDLKPGTEYEFLITNQAFWTSDGYRLKDAEYLVKFKTR